MEQAKQLMEMVAKYESLIYDTADYIWKNPETGYREWKTSAYMEEHFEALGYTLTKAGNIPGFYADLDTGRPGPKIAILGELDSLIVGNHPDADPETHAVHACGHNAQCAILLGVAAAMKEPGALDGLCGSIRFMAVPAEELIELGFREELRKQGVIRYFGGKVEFISRGYFDGVDMAMMIHSGKLPEGKTLSVGQGCNGCITKNITFKGVASHAGGSPHLGRSALDAAELMNVGCNYLREHMIPEARIHYAYIDAGGTAPNVVQDHAVIRYEVRSPWVSQVKDLFERVKNVARGASIMTDTTVDCELAMAFTEYIPNNALAAVADECMKEVGAPKWDEDDYAMAREFLNTYPPVTMENIKSQIIEVFGEDRLEEILERPLDSEIHPFNPDKIKLTAGSTDVGDVGYAAPTLNINIATACIGNVGHSWQMVAQTCSPLAHKGLLTAAKVMALACVRTMDRPDVIEAAKKEVTKRNGGHYTCPLPDSVMPPLDTY